MALLDDLLREAVAATTDDERAQIGQRIAGVEIERDAASHVYPELARAAAWEEVGRIRAAAGDRETAERCLARALDAYRWHASGATSGGEGLARMLDVERLERELASSRKR